MKALYRPGLRFYVDKLNDGEPFTFVRYGDDEWKVMTGHMNASVLNGRTHRLDLPGLQVAMGKTLTEVPDEDNYYPATRNAYAGNPGVVEYHAWLQWMRARRLDLDWHDCNVFADASTEGKLWPFVEAIRGLDVSRVVVGPSWLEKLDETVFPVDVFVPIRETDAWLDVHDIMSRCIEVEPPAFYSVSAGVAAEALCWWLYHYKQYGKRSWILDLGSLWDPFVGVQSRSYHRAMTRDIIKSDLGGGRRDR